MMLLPYIFRVILAFDAKTVYYGPDNMRRANGCNQYNTGNTYNGYNAGSGNPYNAYNQQNPYAPVNDSLNSRENGNL